MMTWRWKDNLKMNLRETGYENGRRELDPDHAAPRW
jgi:hypothetical protein